MSRQCNGNPGHTSCRVELHFYKYIIQTMHDILHKLRQQRLHRPELWLERLIVWGGAAAAGLLIVGFARLSDWANMHFHQILAHHAWWPLLLSPCGGMLVVYLVRRFFSGAEGSGIPQTIAALQVPEPQIPRFLSLRIALAKVGLGALAVGCGFSTGREGPSVQVGACLMHALRRHVPRKLVIAPQHLILAGGAAGIAAAFNTPLAGIIFAIEELARKFEQKTNGVLLTAIVISGVTSIALQGNYLYFGRLAMPTIGLNILLPLFVCSLLCGILGGLFSRSLLWGCRSTPGGMRRFRASHPVIFAGFCGLLVAGIGLMSGGDTFGSGYAATQAMLGARDQINWLFAPLKMLATLISYYSGVPGGIFAPSLSIGAGIAHALLAVFSADTAPHAIFAICMVAFLAAVTQAPITAFIIVMEMIDGHEMVLSLIAAAWLSAYISRLFSPALYLTLATQQLAKASAP